MMFRTSSPPHSSLHDRAIDHHLHPSPNHSPLSSSKIMDHDRHSNKEQPLLSPYTVIIGRGNACKQNTGNQRLETHAKRVLSDYEQAKGRNAKSRVVTSLIDHVHQMGGSFVRYNEKDGTYKEVGMRGAREKVGVVLRNLVGPMKYKSSCQSKVVARRERKAKDLKEDPDNKHPHKKSKRQSPSNSEESSSLSSPAVVLSRFTIPPKPLPAIPQGTNVVNSGGGVCLDSTVRELLSSEKILDIPAEDYKNDDESSSSGSPDEDSLESCWDD